MRTHRTLVPAVLVAGALAVAGCGSDDSSTTSTSSGSAGTTPARTTDHAAAGHDTTAVPASGGTPTAVKGGKVTIDASEFKFAPTSMTAKAGKLTIEMNNIGKVEHELVLLKTTQKADGLKVTGGRVSEDDSVGEVSETAGGKAKSHTFTLKPGTYVYVCNIPGHYMDGMRGTLVVQ
ncbi:plastocyanin/azurin family copper-binding protein [Patulibacter minatonensis]|uniref:plastocyanin/azurin family copper-binding protein n=1 Tax=Patulibacter minatonensis TaxID=298163 RepID=UPI0004B85FD4|nr:plastocyanin/azurin family copper-binding protein [Patulibacter minatonensis]